MPRAEGRGADPRRNRQLEAVSDANLRVADQLAALQDLDAAAAQRMARELPQLLPEQRADAEARLRRQLLAQRHALTALDGLQRDLLAALLAAAKADQGLLARNRPGRAARPSASWHRRAYWPDPLDCPVGRYFL